MMLPFYAGQKVIWNPEISDIGKVCKHGVVYTVSECVSKINPANGLGPFIYVGIVGISNGESYLSPILFVPIGEIKAHIMTFKEIKENKPDEILLMN